MTARLGHALRAHEGSLLAEKAAQAKLSEIKALLEESEKGINLLQALIATPSSKDQHPGKHSLAAWAANRKWEHVRLAREYGPEDLALAFEIASELPERHTCGRNQLRFVTQCKIERRRQDRWLYERVFFCPDCCTV